MPLTDQLSRVALVVNAGSRRGADALDTAAALLHSSGYDEVSTHPVASGRELAATLRRVADSGPDLLVVGGGDGSVACAAEAVAHTGTVLGVLPLGTANDFARTLEVPGDLAGAVRTLVEGRVADVDLGRSGDRAFLNVASMGLSVAVTERLTDRLKKRIGPVAYPVATARAYRAFAPFAARLEFPDGDHDPLELTDLLQLSVGNGRHYGGGHTVAPNASVDDQALDVFAIVRGRLRDHVSVARLLRSGSFVDHDTVHHVVTGRVRITTDRPMALNLDGEVTGATPVDVEVDHNAVHVVVPAASRAADLHRAWRGSSVDG